MAINPITSAEFDESLLQTSKGVRSKSAIKREQTSLENASTKQENGINNVNNVGKIDTEMSLISTQKDSSEHYRQVLPSRGLFYKVKKDLSYRTLKIKDLNKIQYFLKTDNVSYLIDAVQNCILEDIDVRDLTVDDFFFICYQIAFNSHIKPEYEISWTSLYGNENKHKIGPRDLASASLDYKTLREQVPNFDELRFFPCSVRSYETFYNRRFKLSEADDVERWDEETTQLYKNAAWYLNEETAEAQLKRAEDMDINSEEYTALKKFVDYSKHDSMNIELTLTDLHFEASKALEVLKQRLASLQLLSAADYEQLILSDVEVARQFNLADIEFEIQRIEAALNLSQEVRAKTEKIPFRPNLTDFIQPLYL